MQAIINGEMYEVEPAVKVIIDELMIENAELKKENARLEESFQKATGVIAATDCVECKRGTQAKAEPVKHGRWIHDGCGNLVCSNCRWKFSDELLYMSRNLDAKTEEIIGYCMHCGAKMDLKDGETK